MKCPGVLQIIQRFEICKVKRHVLYLLLLDTCLIIMFIPSMKTILRKSLVRRLFQDQRYFSTMKTILHLTQTRRCTRILVYSENRSGVVCTNLKRGKKCTQDVRHNSPMGQHWVCVVYFFSSRGTHVIKASILSPLLLYSVIFPLLLSRRKQKKKTLETTTLQESCKES